MALTSSPSDLSPNNIKQATPANYVDLNAYLNVIDMPDNDPNLVEAYGAQDLTGFLQMTGAITNVGYAETKDWWEETRLMPVQEANLSATAATSTTRTYTSSGSVVVRANDVILLEDGETRAFVTAVSSTGYTVAAFDDTAVLPAVATSATAAEHKIVGNMYAHGTDQPSEFLMSNVRKRTNSFMILKDIFKVNATHVGNKGWVTINGKDFWYIKAQEDFNKRFRNYREMSLLLGKLVDGSATGNISNINGSEGYFSAVEDNGIVTPTLSTLAAVDDLIDGFDVQGSVSDEYMAYLNRTESRNIDDMLAAGLATGALNNGLPSQYGAFNNDKDAAVALGFKSFTRGDYTFHKQGWKLLNETTALRNTAYEGALVPVGKQLDAKSGEYCPSLEMCYKTEDGGVSRLMKSWNTGSIWADNSTVDQGQINYLSEVCLVTRGRNIHGLIKS